uniref:DNA endonuclease Ctp1 N-terminal domain-containing protein n=1 Tax=Oreochromis aureus TaxID=47969 RepID=A0AAZ1X612_OREAU
MECFNDLLHKLKEVHEREIEGWQVKVQELSNKKGCDTKRMEELFTRNQQMKEQHRLLTENIKVLENRLRAGLCDRCTVTQEVAKRRQQEFEASQIQSLQHISLLAGEMNNLKKENKKLKDEIRNLKAALDKGHSDHSSNSSTTTEVKPNSSPALSPSSGILSLVNTTTSRASNKPADGNISVKPDVELKTEETEGRQLRGINRSQFDALPMSALTLPSWKKEHFVTRAGEKRRSSVSAAGEVRPGRHVVHAPVARHPQAINSSSASLRWSLSESSDWITAGTNPVVQTSPNLHSQHFHSLNPTRQQASPRRQVFSPPFPKQSNVQPPAREPTVVFRLTNLPEYMESQTKPTEKTEKKENLLPKVERVSEEGLKELNDGPLDLSDRGKSISSQVPKSDSSSALQDGTRVQKSPELEVNTNSSADIAESSSSPIVIPSSSCATPGKQTEEQAPDKDPNHKQVDKEQDQKEEVNGKTDESKGKKVPILTLSLRPVVVLETLNPALQKQDSLSSNGKSSSATDEPETSSDEQDEEDSRSGQESNQGSKRKRASVETDADRDFNTDSNNHRERKLKITMRSEEKSPR